MILNKLLNSTCDGNFAVTIEKAYGSRIEGIKLARKLGFPTINVALEKEIPCGFYRGNSPFGNITMVVGKHDKKRADVNFAVFKPEIDNVARYEFWNLERVVNTGSDIINTFNNGCCC